MPQIFCLLPVVLYKTQKSNEIFTCISQDYTHTPTVYLLVKVFQSF